MLTRRHLLLAILCFVGLPSIALAEEFQGKVVGVSDGDTIVVLHDKTPVKIRLQAVDCPEKAQAFGQKAKLFTADMVFGKVVTVRVATRDKYGRTVGWVDVGGKSLNEELVRAGLAWHYRQYDKSKKLDALEQEARAAKRGLWADASLTPPWEWRRGTREDVSKGPPPKLNCYQACLRDSAAQAVAIEAIRASCTRKCSTGRVAAVATGHPDSAATVPTRGGELHGNTRSKVFHGPSCKEYSCKHCTAVFASQREAVNAGYRAHPQCTGQVNRPRPGAKQPEQAWSKDKACRVDSDCGLLPLRQPCACSPCGRVQAQAANNKAIEELRARWASLDCKPPNCPACAPLVVGDRAVCINGQCQAR